MNKAEKLKSDIYDFIDTVIDMACDQNKLDHFSIEISNHNGNLQKEYITKDRKKVY